MTNPRWLAPEVILAQKSSQAGDVYRCGVGRVRGGREVGAGRGLRGGVGVGWGVVWEKGVGWGSLSCGERSC